MNADGVRVGFIGLGRQGAPIARRIVEAGFPVTLWARRAETLVPFACTPAKTAGSPAELAAAVDLACVCVLADVAEFAAAVGEFIGKDLVVVRKVAADLGADLGVLNDAHDVLARLLANPARTVLTRDGGSP
jgi:3-hydroxyisobutyrate dehydrogenase